MTFQVSGNPVEGLHAMLTYLVCCHVFVELLIGHQYVAPCMLDNKQFSAKIWPIHRQFLDKDLQLFSDTSRSMPGL